MSTAAQTQPEARSDAIPVTPSDAVWRAMSKLAATLGGPGSAAS